MVVSRATSGAEGVKTQTAADSMLLPRGPNASGARRVGFLAAAAAYRAVVLNLFKATNTPPPKTEEQTIFPRIINEMEVNCVTALQHVYQS